MKLSSFFPSLQLLTTTILLFMSMNLTILGISYKSDHIVCIFLWVTYLTCLQGSSMLQHVSEFPFLKGWIILHCTYLPHFVYPLICWWTFGWYWLLTIMNNVTMNIMYKYFFKTLLSVLFGSYWAPALAQGYVRTL